jgi:hypothetical protein
MRKRQRNTPEVSSRSGKAARLSAWLAILALVFHALLAPLHGPHPAFAQDGIASAQAAEDFCQANPAGDPKSQRHASTPCIFCVSSPAFALAAQDGFQIRPPHLLAAIGWSVQPLALPHPARLESGNPRAPPSFA